MISQHLMYIFKKISKLKEIAIKDEKSLIAGSGARTLSRTPLPSNRVQANIWSRTGPEYRGAFLKSFATEGDSISEHPRFILH